MNYFDQIEDFNWLKKQASPNWKLMDADRHSAIDKQMSLFTSDIKSDGLLSTGLSLLPTQ